MSVDLNGRKPRVQGKMANPPKASSPVEARRQELLREACEYIEELTESGAPIGRVIASAARKYGGVDLGGGYRLAGSVRRFRYYWQLWKRTKNATVFPPKYHAGKGRIWTKPDPLLLRLVYEQCLQSGESLSESLKALREKGVHISMQDMRRALPVRALNRFTRSHEQLVKHRKRLETSFLTSITVANRQFLKKQTALHSRFFERDERVHRGLLRHRDDLQKKFFAADSWAVRKREELQRKHLGSIRA